MDAPAEYHTLMKQAYGLTTPELPQNASKFQKKKDAKSKKAAGRTESSAKAKAAKAKKAEKTEKTEKSKKAERTGKTEKSKNAEKTEENSKDADVRRPSVIPYLQRRDRAKSCIDLLQNGNEGDDNSFKRRALQRKSLYVKSTLTKRLKEVHKSLTSLVTEPELSPLTVEDEEEPAPVATSPTSADSGLPPTPPTNGGTPRHQTPTSPPLWSLATDPLALLREAYQQRQRQQQRPATEGHQGSTGTGTGSGTVRRRPDSMRVRAIRRTKSQKWRRSWDPKLADLMETSADAGDETATGTIGEGAKRDAKETGTAGGETNGVEEGERKTAESGVQMRSRATGRRHVVRSHSIHQVG